MHSLCAACQHLALCYCPMVCPDRSPFSMAFCHPPAPALSGGITPESPECCRRTAAGRRSWGFEQRRQLRMLPASDPSGKCKRALNAATSTVQPEFLQVCPIQVITPHYCMQLHFSVQPSYYAAAASRSARVNEYLVQAHQLCPAGCAYPMPICTEGRYSEPSKPSTSGAITSP